MKVITLIIAIMLSNIVLSATIASSQNLKTEILKVQKESKLISSIALSKVGILTNDKAANHELFSNSYLMLISVFGLTAIILILALLPILPNTSFSTG